MTRANNHTFLGMNINITEDQKVEIYIKEKLFGAIDSFGENIDEKVTTAAYSHTFIVNKQAKQLGEEKREIFHPLGANILYIMKRSRPDLETAISLLFRKVSKSDVDDWKNLRELCCG